MPRPLDPAQRDRIAAEAARRYTLGESWRQIAPGFGLHPDTVRRLARARTMVETRPWGARPALDPLEVQRRRDEGWSIPRIAQHYGCSKTAVRTALESARGAPPRTRYPMLAGTREPTAVETRDLLLMYDALPSAPRNPHAKATRSEDARNLAVACRTLVDDGVPMQTLSLALGRSKGWVLWLLGIHDLLPDKRIACSTNTSAPAVRTAAPAPRPLNGA